jgi:glutamate formiminotransferase
MLIECVPNISTGRDGGVIDSISKSISSIKDVLLLHVDASWDANRTVFTFVGSSKEGILEAAFCFIKSALDKIDMRYHNGIHPRLGAVDVFPFVPLIGASMAECVSLAASLGHRVAEQLHVPVYLYAEAANHKNRISLSNIRSGQYEGLKAKILSSDWIPDYGKACFVEKSGAVTIGARDILIAYNVNLGTMDESIAKEIARRIRGKGVKAIGWVVPKYGCAQVSTNIMQYKACGVFQVFKACKDFAKEFGVQVTGSEIVGMVPEEALRNIDSLKSERNPLEKAIEILGLNDKRQFSLDSQVLERRLQAVKK